jgi:hypothetical protein
MRSLLALLPVPQVLFASQPSLQLCVQCPSQYHISTTSHSSFKSADSAENRPLLCAAGAVCITAIIAGTLCWSRKRRLHLQQQD